jgi:hypothetical protein
LFRSADAVNQRPSSSFCPTAFSMRHHPKRTPRLHNGRMPAGRT